MRLRRILNGAPDERVPDALLIITARAAPRVPNRLSYDFRMFGISSIVGHDAVGRFAEKIRALRERAVVRGFQRHSHLTTIIALSRESL